MDWKFRADAPVYQQIMDVIRSAILAGEYQPGQRVPSIRELATESRVNPNTMHRAMTELEREGILQSQGTMGRVVTTNHEILEKAREYQLTTLAKGYWHSMKALGLSPQEVCGLLTRVMEQEESHE